MCKKTFNILSLDGGGYKGLFTISLLEELEKKFNKSCFDIFDLFAGTSTGSIIALALASGKSAKEIKEAYLELGPKIFNKKNNFICSFFNASYNSKVLNNELSKLYGNLTLGDIANLNKKVIVPATNLTTKTTKIFKTDHADLLNQHNRYKLSDIATASSSAPTYFNSFKLKHPENNIYEYYSDGGLFANNPTSCAIVEAVSFLNQSINNLRVVSIATDTKTTNPTESKERKGLYSWGKDIVKTPLTVTSQIHEFLSCFMLNGRNERKQYVRIQPEINSFELDSVGEDVNRTLIQDGIRKGNMFSTDSLIKELFKFEEVEFGEST